MDKLQVLKSVIGEDFVKINNTDYKTERGDAIIIKLDDLIGYVKEKVKEEIPFLSTSVLKKYLPEKFQNDLILGEYQELAKFDHTLLSNLVMDELGLAYEVLELLGAAEIVLSGSKEYQVEGYIIFYLEHEQN